MTDGVSALLLSPGSVESDSDCEARTTLLLSRVRLEHDPSADYGKYAGLESPDYSKYTHAIPIKHHEIKRFSLSSSASDSSLAGWQTPSQNTPNYKSERSHFNSGPFTVSLVSDSPSSTMSPNDSKGSGRWQELNQASPHTAPYSLSNLSAWSSVSSDTSSIASADNTQTLSAMTWNCRTPFKTTASTHSHKENASPNVQQSPTIKQTMVTKRLSMLSVDSPVTTQTIVFAPSDTPKSYLRTESRLQQPIWTPESTITTGLITSTPASQPDGSPFTTHIGCLVDINDSFAPNISIGSDEITRTIRLEVQREMASLDPSLLTHIFDAQLVTMTADECQDELHLNESTSKSMKNGILNKFDAFSPSISAEYTPSIHGVNLQVGHQVPLTEYGIMVKQVKNASELATGVLNLLCDVGVNTEEWLKPVRAVVSHQDLFSILQLQYDIPESNKEILNDAILILMESGDIEALDLTEKADQPPTRLYRASEACFERHSNQLPVS